MPSIAFITSEEKHWVALVRSLSTLHSRSFLLTYHQVISHAHSPKKNTETFNVSIITK